MCDEKLNCFWSGESEFNVVKDMNYFEIGEKERYIKKERKISILANFSEFSVVKDLLTKIGP